MVVVKNSYIPHRKLIRILHVQTDFYLKGGDREFTVVNSYGFQRINRQEKGSISFTSGAPKRL